MSESFRVESDAYFAIVPEWVLFSDLSDRAVRLYAVIARKAGDSRVAKAPRPWFAERLGSSTSSFDRAVRELEAAGAVCRTRQLADAGDFAETLYTVHRTPCGGCGGTTRQQADLPFGSSQVTRGGVTGDTTGSPTGDDKVVSPVTTLLESPKRESYIPPAGGDTLTTGEPPPVTKAIRDGVWNALEGLFFPAGVTTKTTRKRVGRVQAELVAAGATRTEVEARARRWPDLWPGTKKPTLTLEALAKWWDSLAPATAATSGCRNCGGRRQLAVLLDGSRVTFDHPSVHDVGVDYPVPCPGCSAREATG